MSQNSPQKQSSSFFDILEILVRKYWHILVAFVSVIYMLVGVMLDVSTIKETVRQHDSELTVAQTSMNLLREDILVMKEQMRSSNNSLVKIESLVEKIDERGRSD